MSESILTRIADDKALFDEVKAEVLKQFEMPESYQQISSIQDFSNESLGQAFRARLDGIKAVEDAFREIAKHKTVVVLPKGVNPAR